MADEKNESHGDCEGPDSMYIKLVASDGHEFIIKREVAILSETIKAMLTGPGMFAENETNIIHFKEIESHILQKVCEYLTYKHHYRNSETCPPMFDVPVAMATELMIASHFLEC